MKIHRIKLRGTGSDVSFTVKIPNVWPIRQGRLFVEALTIDSLNATTVAINAIYVKSRELNDTSSFTDGSTANTILRIVPNNHAVNTNKDIRFAQKISNDDIGVNIRGVDLTSWQLSIQLTDEAGIAIEADWVWNLMLLIIDDEPAKPLVVVDPKFSGFISKKPVQETLLENPL